MKLVHASVCVQKINQDGTQSIRYVKHVLLISLLLIVQQARVKLAHMKLQFGINLLTNVRLVQKILISSQTYQNVFLVKMTRDMMKQQKNVFLSANLIKFIINKKESVTLSKN